VQELVSFTNDGLKITFVVRATIPGVDSDKAAVEAVSQCNGWSQMAF